MLGLHRQRRAESKNMSSDTLKSDTQALIEQTELTIKQVELKLKERELANPTSVLSKLKVSATEATIFVGILAFLGSFAGTYFQERNKLALQARQQESALILDALKGDDPAGNLSRLTLMIDAGFVTDKNGAIRTLILSGKYGSIAAPSPLTLLDAMAKGTAPALIQEIVRAIGFTPAIELREQVDFAGIAAVVRQNDRLVLYYDQARLSQFDRNTTNTWTVPAILAHEIGHVVLGHMDRAMDHSTAKVVELASDRFAGQVLRQLGASLEQAQQALAFLPETTTPTHPGREERIEELLKGWRG